MMKVWKLHLLSAGLILFSLFMGSQLQLLAHLNNSLILARGSLAFYMLAVVIALVTGYFIGRGR